MLVEWFEKRWLINQDGRPSDRTFQSHCAICEDVRVFQRCGDSDSFMDNYFHYYGQEKPKVMIEEVKQVEELKVTIIAKPGRPQPRHIFCYDCQDFRFTVGERCPTCRRDNIEEWRKSDMRRVMSESKPQKSGTDAGIADTNTISHVDAA